MADARWYLIVVLIYISVRMNDGSVLSGLLGIFLGKMFIQVLCPVFYWIICLFIIEL